MVRKRKKPVSISVDPDEWEQFKKLCHDLMTNPSEYISKLIREVQDVRK